MSELLKNNISTYADLTAYNADTNKDYPNVSYIEGTDEVKYGTNILVAKYNITTTYEKIQILYTDTGISKMWIDGVEQQYPITTYRFDTTGEHTVKMTFSSTQTSVNFNGINSVKSVIIPNTITNIGVSFLRGCHNLTSVIIPNGVKYIGNGAFYVNNGLTTITIPSSVTYIARDGFRYCDNLTSITCLATTPPGLDDSNVFQTSNSNNYPIYVPAASVNTYKAATYWSRLASRIQAIPTT